MKILKRLLVFSFWSSVILFALTFSFFFGLVAFVPLPEEFEGSF